MVNNYLDWSRILNIDPVYKDELSLVFGLLACFFCLNIVASVFTTMLTADQKPALASLISTSGQVLAFACVYVLTKTTKGSLSALAVSFSAIPCLFLLIVSIIVYQTKKYKIVAPSLRDVRFSLVRSVVGLDGWVFHKLFRKAEQKDLLNNAITCIAKGDTGFRLDTKKLTGKEPV